MNFRRKVFYKGMLALASCTVITATAQQGVDSTYHNYLYDSRTAYFGQLAKTKKPIVFFGDSITQWGDWAELLGFRPVLNRGIAGDNSFGLLARVEEVIRHQPEKLFILIGTNDINLNGDKAASYVIANYKKIIEAIRSKTPNTKIFIQSVLPVNNTLINRQYYKGTNEQILALNGQLKELARTRQVKYIDVFSHLLDGQQQLEASYTYDGLHLSGKGYRTWIQLLQKEKLL